MMTITGLLRAAAAEQWLTRAQLAEATGIKVSRIRDLMLGNVKPRPDELEKLAKALPLLKATVKKVAR